MKTLEQTITAEQKKRIKREWMHVTKEEITIKVMGNDIYAFGSECSCLRLLRLLVPMKCKAEYSINLKSWFFVLYANQPD
jgi:hypothetical protein